MQDVAGPGATYIEIRPGTHGTVGPDPDQEHYVRLQAFEGPDGASAALGRGLYRPGATRQGLSPARQPSPGGWGRMMPSLYPLFQQAGDLPSRLLLCRWCERTRRCREAQAHPQAAEGEISAGRPSGVGAGLPSAGTGMRAGTPGPPDPHEDVLADPKRTPHPPAPRFQALEPVRGNPGPHRLLASYFCSGKLGEMMPSRAGHSRSNCHIPQGLPGAGGLSPFPAGRKWRAVRFSISAGIDWPGFVVTGQDHFLACLGQAPGLSTASMVFTAPAAS